MLHTPSNFTDITPPLHNKLANSFYNYCTEELMPVHLSISFLNHYKQAEYGDEAKGYISTNFYPAAIANLFSDPLIERAH